MRCFGLEMGRSRDMGDGLWVLEIYFFARLSGGGV